MFTVRAADRCMGGTKAAAMCASRAVARRVRELFEAVRPAITEMVEKNDPSVEGLKFSDIEDNSAAAGDLLARLMMEQAVRIQPEPTAEEIERARRGPNWSKAFPWPGKIPVLRAAA